MTDFINLQQFLQLADLGTAVIMLFVFIRMYKKKDDDKDKVQEKFVEILREMIVSEQESTNVMTDMLKNVESLQSIVDDKLKRIDNNDQAATTGDI